jgi:hypothetical protein
LKSLEKEEDKDLKQKQRWKELELIFAETGVKQEKLEKLWKFSPPSDYDTKNALRWIEEMDKLKVPREERFNLDRLEENFWVNRYEMSRTGLITYIHLTNFEIAQEALRVLSQEKITIREVLSIIIKAYHDEVKERAISVFNEHNEATSRDTALIIAALDNSPLAYNIWQDNYTRLNEEDLKIIRNNTSGGLKELAEQELALRF